MKKPKAGLAGRMEAEVRRRWLFVARKRARDQAARQTGLVIETRARFGFTAAPDTSDGGRMRRITQHLPPEFAGRLPAAQDAGASEAELQQIAAEGLEEVYFKDSGSRAQALWSSSPTSTTSTSPSARSCIARYNSG